jgi:hypothetical protein
VRSRCSGADMIAEAVVSRRRVDRPLIDAAGHKALAVSLAWMGDRPRPRLRSSAARSSSLLRDNSTGTSGHERCSISKTGVIRSERYETLECV